jgi:adenine phosphoribosyltransferase
MIIKDYPHVRKAFETTIVEKIGNYPYPISPLAGANPIKPELLNEIVKAVKNESVFKEAELIVTFESAGAQLAAVIGQELKLPYVVAKKKSLNLEKEISFNVTTNFDEKTFYLYGDLANKKIIIIDDVVSSGETIKSAYLALNEAGAKVVAFFTVAAKTNFIGRKYQDVLKDIHIPLISLVKIKIINDKVIVF